MTERERVEGRVTTWPPGSGRARRLAPWLAGLPELLALFRERLVRWVTAEAAPGRLVPWLPVAFGGGIVLYFSATQEPQLWAALVLAAGCCVGAFLARARPIAFPLLMAVAAAAMGFAVVAAKSARVAHPILRYPAWDVGISGFVAVREERERTDRIVVQVHQIHGRRLEEAPDRVRLSVRKGTAPQVGTFVELKARLNPPTRPLRPGGYDFARDLYFQGIGATGFVSGAIKTVPPPQAAGLRLRYAAFIQGLRDSIDKRIRSSLPGDVGAIASALITGKRDAISAPVNEAMYVSSLAHVLSISGYHMAVVAGVVFFLVRALLALSPPLAIRFAIKKWAALAALIAAFGYLLLSGAEVATQRAFIMTAIVLAGVMVDRAALTLRNLALAALGVLLIAPEAVVHPSFQMSFAATLALVAIYERGLPWKGASAETPIGARIALWGGREILMLVLASLVAGFATTPFAAYHFHRLAPYGVLANLLAMPIVSAWVMPLGLVALAAMPLGFDAPLWGLMGLGVEWMISVALLVAGLPGAVGRMAAFGAGPLLLGTLGLVTVCMLRSPLRWAGGAMIVAATALALRTPLPEVLIADRGESVAVRGPDGRLAIMQRRADAFALREWLGADADPRPPNDPTLREGVTCDAIGCVVRRADGGVVALVLAAEAFEEDCRRAILIVTQRTAPPGCGATVVDRSIWPQTGALALYRSGKAWEMVATHPRGYDRPWAKPPRVGVARPATPPRDATPRPEDLAPDD